MKFLILILVTLSINAFAKNSDMLEKMSGIKLDGLSERLDSIEDIRMAMEYAGFRDSNPGVFKKEVLEGLKGNAEEIVQKLEEGAAKHEVVKREVARKGENFKEAKRRLRKLDVNEISDPILKDIVTVLNRDN